MFQFSLHHLTIPTGYLKNKDLGRHVSFYAIQIERKERKHCSTFNFYALYNYFFQNTLYYLPRTGLSLIVENHGKYAILRSLFRESILSISLGVLFIKTPFRTSQAPAQIPESAMQLEDLTPQFLTVAPLLSYHKNVTLMPPIKATQTLPG